MSYYIGYRESNNLDIAFLKGYYPTIEAAQKDIDADTEKGLYSKFPDGSEVICDDDESNDY